MLRDFTREDQTHTSLNFARGNLISQRGKERAIARSMRAISIRLIRLFNAYHSRLLTESVRHFLVDQDLNLVADAIEHIRDERIHHAHRLVRDAGVRMYLAIEKEWKNCE